MLKKVTLALIIAILAFNTLAFASSHDRSMDIFSDIHTYNEYVSRINNIMESCEWREMSREERIAATQLTQDEISRMSTETLLRASLSAPFLLDIFHFNCFRRGFEVVLSQNPGLQELSLRSDLVYAFAYLYEDTANETQRRFSQYTAHTKPGSVLLLPIMEMIIAQPEMQHFVTADQATNLVELFVERRIQDVEESVSSSFFFDIVEQSDGDSVFCDAVTNIQSRSSHVATMFDNGAPPGSFSTTIQTPRRSAVIAWNTSNVVDWSPEDRRMWREILAWEHPRVTIVRDASLRFNCHSYAFHSTAGANIWLLGRDIRPFFTDGSFVNPGVALNGDVMEWVQSDHSGIIASFSSQGIMVVSKWGMGPLIRSCCHDTPYFGTTRFWRRQ